MISKLRQRCGLAALRQQLKCVNFQDNRANCCGEGNPQKSLELVVVKAWASAIESSGQLFLDFRSGSGSERAAISSGSGGKRGLQLHL